MKSDMSNSKDDYSKLVIYQRKDNDLGVIRGHCPHFFPPLIPYSTCTIIFLPPNLCEKRMMVMSLCKTLYVPVHMKSLEVG